METSAVRRAAAAAACIALLCAPRAEAGIGRTPGFASVGEDGQALYSVSIALPPGTNGLTPVLSLDYRHRTRGGLLGVGFSIGGLSQIARCARTVAQDGVAAPPTRGGFDRFCLDGQRLVVAGGIVYSAPNAQYRTEVESFARVRAVAGASQSGPDYFVVEAADGRIYEYGATTDSRIDGSTGASTQAARAWALSRVRDRAGNIVDYRYEGETGSTSFRIAAIRYNANPANGVAASDEVRFVYILRPNSDLDAGFVAGMPVRQVQRLERIEVRHADAVLRSYKLAYEPALSSGGRSRLASVTECGAGGGDCLAPTTFHWQDGAGGTSAVKSIAIAVPFPLPVPDSRTWNLADINGDGRSDYVWVGGSDGPSSTIRYRLSLEGGAPGPAANSGIPARHGMGVPFDADGDGRTDLLVVTPGFTWAIARGGPAGLGPAVDTGIALPGGLRDFRGADLNGDGLGDIAWSEAPDPLYNSLVVRARLALAGGGFGAPVTLYSQLDALGYVQSEGGDFIGRPGQRVDLDGDGSEDLLMNENYSIARISLSAFGTERLDMPLASAVAFDFNDDGCTDIAYKHGTGGIRVRASTCMIAGTAAETAGPAWTGPHTLNVIDWNGDGRDDLLLRGAANWTVALSRADSLAPLADTGVPHEGNAAISGCDVDGDGLQDLVGRTPSQLRVRYRTGPVPDLLVAATDGFGVGAEFAYRPMTDDAVYGAGTGSAWPEPEARSNALVVSGLTVTDGSGRGRRATELYRYESLRRNVQGRGSLGFRRVIRTPGAPEPGLSVELTRRQDFPFTGLPESIVVRQAGGKAVASTAYRWARLDFDSLAGARRFPYPSTTTTRIYAAGGALDGSEITRTVRSVAAIDAESGLVTDETTTITESGGGANAGSSASQRILYAGVLNDTANWCLGRPLEVEVTASHTLAGGSAVTRAAEQAWDGAACRPTQMRLSPGDPKWQVTYDLAYDAFGNLASEKLTGAGMAARTMALEWDARGRFPVRVVDPLGQATRLSWDEARGLPRTFTDPNGLVTRWDYDNHGRVMREVQPDGTTAQWMRESCKAGCDARTRFRLRQDDLDTAGIAKVSAWLEVDQFDRGIRLESQEPGGGRSAAQLEFGARGELTRRLLPHWDGGSPPGHVAFSYDVLGRPTGEQLVAAGGTIERAVAIRYDGLAVTRADALGRESTATHTAWGSLTEVADARGGRTRYEHDAFGGLLRVKDAEGDVVSTVGYNPRGMKISVDDADGGAWAWTRNALGETTALEDAKGQVTRFTYDALGRLTRRTSPDGESRWTWGQSAAKREIGRLTGLAGPGYSEAFTYDAAGRPASLVIAADASYRFDYSYDALGLLDTVTYPTAGTGARFRIRHRYDAGRLSSIANADAPADSYWTLNAQDAGGNVLDETMGGAVRIVSGFSPLDGRLEYRQAGPAGGGAVQDLAYAWDAAGNLSARRDLRQGLLEEFRYDDLDRLAQARRNGALTLELDYDATGNIRRKSDACPGDAACYAYDPDRKHAVVTAGGRSYAYDANGNMTSRAGAAIAWDAANRPVSIAGAGGSRSQLAYGPEGNRWRQVARSGATTETTIYAAGLFEKATQGGATAWRHYVPAPGGVAVQVRTGDGAPPAMRYLLLDHLGSTDRIVDAAGREVAAASFAPFGARRKASWTGVPTAAELAKVAAVSRDGFTGHESLDAVGLVHMNGRVYDPLLGRFISADPYVTLPHDGQGLNRYAYALNNPLAVTDPSGFDPVPCAATPDGQCVQITVIGVTWAQYMRAAGGAHASEIASALERDPCGQNGSALACAMQVGTLVSPSSIVLTVGSHRDPTLPTGGGLDAVQGFAAGLANATISASPVAMLFGTDPDFEFFRVPDSAPGRTGGRLGTAASFAAAGIAGVVRKGGREIIGRSPTAVARSLQGTRKYPSVDRFKDIVLKKGTILYAGFPGQGMFYTTASALRRSGGSAEALWQGLQVAPHQAFPPRARMAAFEVIEDTRAAFGLALANTVNGAGGLPQIVVPSFRTSLEYLRNFALAP